LLQSYSSFSLPALAGKPGNVAEVIVVSTIDEAAS